MAWVEVDDPFKDAISAPKAVDSTAPLPPPYRPELSAPPEGLPTALPATLLARDVADAGAPPPAESGPRWREVENPFAEKPAPLSFAGMIAEAGRAGLAQGLQSVTDAPTAFSEPTGDRVKVNPQVQALLDTPISKGWSDPAWLAAQMTHGLASSAPSLATGFAGGAIGSAYGPGGQLAGSALGFGLGSALQTVAPAYQKARAEGLDHDAAVSRAMQETGIAGAFGAAMGAAPGAALFGKSGEALKRPLGEALAQVFGVQPALSVAQQAAIKINEGKGLPTAEEAAQTALIGAATGAVLIGGHRLGAAAIDQLRASGVEPTPINFEGRPHEPGRAPAGEPAPEGLPPPEGHAAPTAETPAQARLRPPTRAEDLPIMPDEEALPPVPQDQGPADRLPGAPEEARRPTLNESPTPESAAPTVEEAAHLAKVREAAARAFPKGGINEINAYRENAGTIGAAASNDVFSLPREGAPNAGISPEAIPSNGPGKQSYGAAVPEGQRTAYGAPPESGRADAGRRGVAGTETVNIPGHSGVVTAEKPEGGRTDRRTYRIYPEGLKFNRLQSPTKQHGEPLGYATLSRHPDGRWQVDDVDTSAAPGRGLAQKLYDSIEEHLGAPIEPSGFLTKDGYQKLWQNRRPEAVKDHRWSKYHGHYLSPLQIKNAISLVDASLAAPGLNPASAWAKELPKERAALQAAWDSLPQDAKDRATPDQMFSLSPEDSGAEAPALLTPHAKWGNPRENEMDKTRALNRLHEIASTKIKDAPWSDVVASRMDIAQIIDNLYKYPKTYDLQRLHAAPDGDITQYMNEPKDVSRITGQHNFSIYNDPELAPEIRDVVSAAKTAIDHVLRSGRKGVMALYGEGKTQEPIAAAKGNPGRVGDKMASGFYSLAGRKLADVPEALFAQGAQPVIDWLQQAGVKRAELKHFGLDKLPPREPTTRAQFQQVIADRAINFKGKLSTLNPERSKTDYKLGGTRAFTGPRIPGRGTYFEKLSAFPKTLPGGEPFAPGHFQSPHWEGVHPGTWASWRGSVRDIPGWGKMVIGEEGQSDYMQGANVGRRPRMPQDAYLAARKERGRYEKVIGEVHNELSFALRHAGVGVEERRPIVGAFTGEGAEPHAVESWGHRLQQLRDRTLEALPESDWSTIKRTFNRVRVLHEKNPKFFEPGAKDLYARTERAFTPETPLDESYVRTMARDLLLHAAKQGADSVAVATSKTTSRIQANEGAAHFYDKQMAPTLQKELRRITGDGSLTMERVELPKAMGGPRKEKPYDVWAAPMTTAARDKILSDGLPLFSLRGFYSPAGRAIETFPQDIATVGQWSALLAPGKIPGVTKDWRDYVDIDGALKQLADEKGKVSKAALKAYVDAADVDLDLVTLRGPDAPKEETGKTPIEQQKEERRTELDESYSVEPADESLVPLVTDEDNLYEHIAETSAARRILRDAGFLDEDNNYRGRGGYPTLDEMRDLGIHVNYADSRALEERGGDTSGMLIVHTAPEEKAFTIMDDGWGGTDMRRYHSQEAAENTARRRHDDAVEQILDDEFGEDAENEDEDAPETQYHDYIIPGARYMAELLVKPKSLEGKYESKHFDTHEILHQRLGEVDLPPLPGQTAPRKGLLIEETQSDAHALGEDIGYEKEPERLAALKAWQDKRDAVERIFKPLREDLAKATDGFSYNLNAMQEKMQEAVDGLEDRKMRSLLRGLFSSWINPLMRVMARHGDVDAPADAPLLPSPEALMEERGRRMRADIDPREWEQGVMMAKAFLELVPEREAKLVRKFAVQERAAKNAIARAGEENKYPATPEAKMLDIPYKGGLWLDLGLKLALRYAVENGYDTIVLPKARMIGDAVGAPRISELDWSAVDNNIVLTPKDKHGHPFTDDKTEKVQTIELKGDPQGGHTAALAFIAKKFGAPAAESVRYDLAMGRMNPLQAIPVESHASAWEMAAPGELHGRVQKEAMPEGGAANLGMQLQYEDRTPAFFAKYTAKWGGKVTEEPIHDLANKLTSDDFEAATRDAIRGDAPQHVLDELDDAAGESRWGHPDKAYRGLSAEAKAFVDRRLKPAPVLKTIDITPQMREAILGGQPLYNKRGGKAQLDGYWSRRQRTIGIALSAADPIRVFHEESAHAMGPNGLDLLSPQQNALLRQTAVKEGWVEKYIGETDAARYRAAYRHAPDVEGLILQEAIDHAYADYAVNRDAAAVPKEAGTAFDRVRQFFERTKKALVSRGVENVSDIFGGMYSGDVGGRYREPELIRFHDLLPVAGGMAGSSVRQIDFADLTPEQAPVIGQGVRVTFSDLIPRAASR
jgi:hypothetical protein